MKPKTVKTHVALAQHSIGNAGIIDEYPSTMARMQKANEAGKVRVASEYRNYIC